MKDRHNGYKIAQYQSSLRDEKFSLERGLDVTYLGADKISQNRFKHPKEFTLLPKIYKSKDYDSYMPHDMNSILHSRTILVKMTDDVRNDGEYGLKLKSKNANNIRHLIDGQHSNQTLQWEASLRES